MRLVKTYLWPDTPLGQRLRQAATLHGLGHDLGPTELARRARLARTTLTNAMHRGRLSYAIAKRLASLFEDGAADWFVDGSGIAPTRPRMAPHSWQDAGSGEIGSPGRIFEMEAAAQRIAEALKADLRSSEIVIDLHRHDLERQRALVWALKDLARQLRHTGYRMEEMFELTDVLAAEIGLPVRPQKKEEP